MAGTQVLTREGFKNIEDIQPGDYVYSTSDETGESDYKEVLEVFVKETEVITHVFYGAQEEDGEIRTEEIETTLNHRFWSEGKWKSAGTLKAGDLLTLADGTQVEVTDVTYEDRHETVYNMEVADYHTYYVGEDGVWVHNRYGQQGGSIGSSDKSLWTPNNKRDKLWSKGKLKAHFEKHGAEVGATTKEQYSNMAYEFGTRQSNSIIQARNGSYVYRYDSVTNEVFVGTYESGRIKSYYIWDGRTDDLVINFLKEAGLCN